MKYIIVDKTNTIQDIASDERNLSRGHTFAGISIHQVPGDTDCVIGDHFIDDKVLPSQSVRQEKQRELIQREMIRREAERISCGNLNFREKEQALSGEIKTLRNALESLSNP